MNDHVLEGDQLVEYTLVKYNRNSLLMQHILIVNKKRRRMRRRFSILQSSCRIFENMIRSFG